MYFNQFPVIAYSFNIKGKDVLIPVRDIALNVRVRKDILQNVTLFDDYDIADGDTPEIISQKLYGTPLYHWTIMIVNEKYDYLEDFPKNDDVLAEYTFMKYRSSDTDDRNTVLHNTQHILNGSPHFINNDGDVVDGDAPFAVSVSNFEHEFAVNEEKRRIRVINPRMISTVATQLQEAVEPFTE
jgi:hypothetical protein